MRRGAAVLTFLLAVGQAGAAEPRDAVSCSAASLWFVAKHHGFDIDVERLSERLPVRPTGATVEEVLDVAEDFGLSLVLRRIDAKDSFPSSAMIVLLAPEYDPKQRTVGHMVAAWPLDSEGRQFQLLDPAADPRVMDSWQIRQRPFSNWILVPGWSWRRIARSLSVASYVCLAATLVLYFRRRLYHGAFEAFRRIPFKPMRRSGA
ncbi:MAG: cysteine peptidase family C39 domain-containing protein [Planctomycetia bacterium]